VIHSLRLDGVLIGSSKERPYGYYLPANELEAKKFLDTYGAEMFDMLSVYNRQKRAKRDYLDQFNNQGSFNFNKEATGQLAFISGSQKKKYFQLLLFFYVSPPALFSLSNATSARVSFGSL
ncbi:MAG: hypothetical protein WC875_06095, partial [Candidatus Absconditabacterales bacterium]